MSEDTDAKVRPEPAAKSRQHAGAVAEPDEVLSPAPTAPRRRRVTWTPYVLLVPAVVILLAALAYPVGWQLVTSTQQFGLAQQFHVPPDFVGAANYLTLLADPQVWTVVARSLAFCLVNAILTVLIGVGLAMLMNAVGRLPRLILQIALLLAWAMPVVASMTVFVWLFNWHTGVVNWLLTRLGFDYVNHNWLASPLSFYFVATVIVVWMSVPFVSFSVYAGLTQISGEVLEAAQLDGAGGWRRFANITLPMIRPVLMIVLLLQIIWDLRVFTQIKLLQDAGAPIASTDLLGTYIYRLGVASSDFGMAAAMSVFVLILTILVSAPYVRSLIKEDN
ncbi:MAG: sugar ABC transporter permease [Propionibacteriaceae bacterium]|jgi:N,N'-diacetylchitobiose transport system permease protein|nr:sugar ABC transporter permease [Propionibacteriaceae bacterium]